MSYKIIEEFNENELLQVHHLFQQEWWTKDRTMQDMKQMFKNSGLVVGVLDEETEELIGFARVITDTVYRAFIFDVIAKETARNKGIGSLLMKSILSHPRVSSVDRVELYCPDRLAPYYERFGFSTEVNGSRLMRLVKE
ncbi:GNAT family N-acetyltransferase [Fictibacillus iocasae]|uniref:GNAT family N-acetyltransferase n=1 Tax=Fictibacillus iocasae TaxID=2715437 RepID=A0ABW2NQ44_9BACL